jgi:hypothetical protein
LPLGVALQVTLNDWLEIVALGSYSKTLFALFLEEGVESLVESDLLFAVHKRNSFNREAAALLAKSTNTAKSLHRFSLSAEGLSHEKGHSH